MAKAGGLFPNWPPMKLWLDASLSSTYTLADTNRCTSWRNKLNSTHDFTSSGDARPTYVASAINSLPAFQFDQTDDILTYSGRVFTATKGTIFFVATFGDVDARLTVIAQSYNGANNVLSQIRRLEQTTYNSRPVGTAEDADTAKATSATSYSLTPSTAYVLGLTTTGTNDGQWYANRASQTSTNQDPGWRWFGAITSTTPNRTSLGARISLGSPNGTEFHSGYIAEIMAWDGIVLSSRELYKVQTYLGTKYGVTLS